MVFKCMINIWEKQIALIVLNQKAKCNYLSIIHIVSVYFSIGIRDFGKIEIYNEIRSRNQLFRYRF